MNDGLTARQTQILKVIADEYIDTAIPVGSEVLEKKYELGVSPATIRNEMVSLTRSGYLKQPHTSAGRVPTPKAMKFYVDQLMEEKKMSLTDEVKAKEEVWDVRSDIGSLMRATVRFLAMRTGSLSIAVDDEGRVWHAGYSHIFVHPEFADMRLCEKLFQIIEESKQLEDAFFKKFSPDAQVEVFFGKDLGWSGLSSVSIVGTSFPMGKRRAVLGVLGPTRASYPTVIPVLRYYGNMIQEVAQV